MIPYIPVAFTPRQPHIPRDSQRATFHDSQLPFSVSHSGLLNPRFLHMVESSLAKRSRAAACCHWHVREMTFLTQSARSLERRKTEGCDCVHRRGHFHESAKIDAPSGAEEHPEVTRPTNPLTCQPPQQYPVLRSLPACPTLGNRKIQNNRMFVDNHPAVDPPAL